MEERCPLYVARRRAEQAHILVVNHSLLLADVAAGNRVLPSYADLIVDEAHHLEAAVTDGLSFRADRRYLETLLDQIKNNDGGLVADLQARVRAELPPEVSEMVEGYAGQLRDTAQAARERLDEFFDTLEFSCSTTPTPTPSTRSRSASSHPSARSRPGSTSRWPGPTCSPT